MTRCCGLQVFFSVVFCRCIYSLLILEHTLDQHRSYKDCFIDSTVDKQSDDYLFYCLRLNDFTNESHLNDCYTGARVSFQQLYNANVSTNDLLEWHIPLDVADFYGAFLPDSNVSNDSIQFICNCSLSNVFGRYCEYSFVRDIDTLEDLIHSSIEEKKRFYPKERLLTCYEVDSIDERCLDYRDICDGEWDTMTGDDELFCDQIEMNVCENDQFRCRNGLCIARQFLFDGQGDCTDLSDEQSLLIVHKYRHFENCYQKSTFDCDEHWCGREMISCGDGECIPWLQRFWNEHDCRNSYTHVYNCELEERQNKSIDFSITNDHGRCTSNVAELNQTDDQCLLMIKCAVTLHPSCQSIGIDVDAYEKAIENAYSLCQNYTMIKYASGMRFLSPFIDAYHIRDQLNLTVELEFFALMNIRVPGRFCFVGERMCGGIKVTENGSRCINYSDVYGRKDPYPFPPYDYLFCQSNSRSMGDCSDTKVFYRCRTSGECISKYRLFDGFVDCLDFSDENNSEIFHSIESRFLKDRYNCTMDGSISTAVMRHFLGDGISHCKDGSDEMSRSINWQQQQCFESNDYSCSILRHLFNSDEEQPIQTIRFTSLCNSIWDLRNGSDETDCHQWICESGWIQHHSNESRWSGNCINSSWQCNQIWDYYDGSDEDNCNYTEPYPVPQCLSLKKEKIITLLSQVAGDDQIDCLGGIDERVTFACQDGFPLNERFLCNDQMTCLKPMYVCNHISDCPNGEDESEHWCGLRPPLNSSICYPNRFACQERNDSGPCIPQEDRCHDQRQSCLKSHRDEHMCIHPRQYNRVVLEINSSLPMEQTSPKTEIPPWYCDRGLVVYRYDKPACLCPPAYFGNRCEKHAHRLTVIFTWNTDLLKAELIRLVILLINHNETIDHVLLTQHSSHKGKYRVYFNYPRHFYSDLRKQSNKYNVQFRLYAVTNNTVQLASVLQYPIKYSFLPAFRLAIALEYKEPLMSTPEFFTENFIYSPCAHGSACLMQGKQHITCICTSHHYGPTCHLTTIACPLNFCHNNGRCISYRSKLNISEYRCLCSNDTFGERCEHEKSFLSLHFPTQSSVHLIQLINLDQIKMQLKIVQQHRMLTNFERIFYDHLQLPSIGLLKIYEKTSSTIYLLYFNESYSNLSLTEQNQTECKHAKEFNLIPMNSSYDALLFTMKRYHRPCQQVPSAVCFYDPNVYFCFCDQSLRRSTCFFYDFKSDQCNQCLNNGRCIRGDLKSQSDLFCLCPSCYHGHLCEFSTEAFGFTLDSLIVKDSFILQIFYLCLVTILFLVGLSTNTCSILTFIRASPRKVGVGNYLFVAAILNQLSLFFLVVKILSILLGTIHIAHLFFCKTIAYFLSVTTRANYWLTTWITIERLITILFPTLTTLRKPNVAIAMIIITLVIVCGMHIHELMFYTVIEYSSLCIPIFQSSTVSIYNQTTVIFHHLVPFLVQVITITLLIILATRSRVKSIGGKMTFKETLKKQFHAHKELYLTPAIIVLILSILPQAILSFSTVCTELKDWQRYILLATCFLSYLPQMLGFILQVLPLTRYTTEFRETSMVKFRFFNWLSAPKSKPKEQQQLITLAILSAKLNSLVGEQLEELRAKTVNVQTTSL